MKYIRWEYKITRIVLFICLIFFLILVAEWVFIGKYREMLRQKVENTKGSGYQTDALPVYQFLQHPVDYYEEMVERPLFIQGRKPIEELEGQAAINVPETPKGKFDLVFTGSIETPETGIVAMFENLRSRDVHEKFKQLAEGDSHNGWIILKINPDSVLLQDGANEETLMLRAPKKQKNPFKPPVKTRPKARKAKPEAVKKIK